MMKIRIGKEYCIAQFIQIRGGLDLFFQSYVTSHIFAFCFIFPKCYRFLARFLAFTNLRKKSLVWYM